MSTISESGGKLHMLGVTPVAQWSIGRGDVQNYLQDKLKGVPAISSELPYEAVINFTPDLLLIDSAEMVAGEKYNQYAQIAPTYVVGNAQNNDWREELQSIGSALGKSDQAKQTLANYLFVISKDGESPSKVSVRPSGTAFLQSKQAMPIR
ncbi:ABC transporter substrate-binding protein [Paenibacillus sp. Z6-24]